MVGKADKMMGGKSMKMMDSKMMMKSGPKDKAMSVKRAKGIDDLAGLW